MSQFSNAPGHYLISIVVKRSGVKADLIRAWERRYQAVTPTRTEGGHRVYSDLDIARLSLLNRATREGHSISRIAQLSLDELNALVQDSPAASPVLVAPVISVYHSDQARLVESYIEQCYAAMLAFDAKMIEAHFENAVVELGAELFMEKLLTPLLTRIGDDWKTGHLRPAHEHITTAVVRSMVYILRSNYMPAKDAPRIVIGTPIGEWHELGALLAALIAEFKGWHITYLGPNLPAEEIAFAVKSSRADALAMSITVSSEAHLIAKEIRRLKKLIGRHVALIVGGKAVTTYQAVLTEVGAIQIEDCEHFKQVLEQLAVQFKADRNV